MPISGRYTGLMTAPLAGSQRLELRVDVDRLGPHAAVMNRVSGDVYDVGNGEETYRESWIVEQPKVVPGSDKTRIDGPVKFWKRPDAPATIRLGISPSGKAEVILTLADGTDEIYECDRSGSEFREVTLEVDVCESVAPLRLPEYDVTSHPDHPGGLVRRTMKLSSAFREAGVAVTILTGPPEVKDGKPEFATWSDAELHHALTSHFKGQRSLWPQWSLWGLLAGSNERGDAGVMFDQVDPDRQGFAVFKSPVFAGLPSGHTSAVEQEVAALRMYLFTWVHEMGHAFNMVHSADKLRSRALSWMNNPINFDGGPREFWGKFPFQFDDKELEHIRHGDMAAVIMGG
ncbi:MAG TPA: hypothetical protein VFO67_11955, partial [Gemmatimonadales bacterium]|nr:hypothetical protein [Gemmatimonadales bacterium]